MKQFIIITMLLFCSIVFGQNCQITFTGKIIDFHNGEPLVGATVFIKNLNKYTTSNVNGTFMIKNLCKGELTIEVSHVGCKTKITIINIDKDTTKQIHLEHHLEELNEVVVATNSKTEKTSIQQSITKSDIESFSDKSLGDALNNISGVSSLNTGNTIVKPMIHGLHSSRLLIVNNNVRLFDQEWGQEHAPNIDINSGGRIDVVKGANTLMYGSDAIGGLILIKPMKYAAKDSLFGSTSMSLNSNGWGGNINTELIKTYKNGFYAKAQASYKAFGGFETPDYNLSNTGIKNFNASTAIGFNSFEKGFEFSYSFVDNTIGILSASHIGNVNDLVEAINNEGPPESSDFTYKIDNPKQSITHHLAKIEVFKRYKDLGKLTLQYDFQLNRRKEFDLRRGDDKDTPVIDLRLITNSLLANLKLDAYERLKLNVGALLRYQKNDAISGTGVSPIIPDFDKYDAGVYVIGTYNLGNNSEINAGLRYDFSRIEATKRYRITDWYETYNYDKLFPEFDTGEIVNSRVITRPEFTFHNFSASLGYKKQFDNDFELLINYGLASRTPNPSELFSDGLHHSAARIEIGKLTMNKEVANKFVVSFERHNQNFGFAISPYYKYITDFIQLIPTGTTTTVRGAFPVWEYNQVDAQIFGIDLDINKSLSNHFSYNGNLSLLQGDNLTNDIPLIHMPSTNFANDITYKNEKLNQLTIGLKQKTVLQQNRFPDYNFYTFNPVIQEDVYVDISSTPSAYTLFDFNSSASFNVLKTGTLKVEFNVENLFDVSYRENLNRLRYFADEIGRNYNVKIKLNY